MAGSPTSGGPSFFTTTTFPSACTFSLPPSGPASIQNSPVAAASDTHVDGSRPPGRLSARRSARASPPSRGRGSSSASATKTPRSAAGWTTFASMTRNDTDVAAVRGSQCPERRPRHPVLARAPRGSSPARSVAVAPSSDPPQPTANSRHDSTVSGVAEAHAPECRGSSSFPSGQGGPRPQPHLPSHAATRARLMSSRYSLGSSPPPPEADRRPGGVPVETCGFTCVTATRCQIPQVRPTPVRWLIDAICSPAASAARKHSSASSSRPRCRAMLVPVRAADGLTVEVVLRPCSRASDCRASSSAWSYSP